MRSLLHTLAPTYGASSRNRRLTARAFWNRREGQSLVEVAIMLPLLTILMLYAVDFGYFFLVAASLSASSRTAVEYSIQGYNSVSQGNLPAGGPITDNKSVSGLALGDLASLLNSSSGTSVQVCKSSVAATTASCTNYGAASTLNAPDLDPEGFPLNRIEVIYTIQPPIPLGFFGTNLGVPTKFHRIVEMRTIV